MFDRGTNYIPHSAIRAISKFGEVVGFEILQSIVPQLKISIEDPKWRVRSEAINATVNLALSYQVFVNTT